MGSRVIKTEEDLDKLVDTLCELEWPVSVEWTQGFDRTEQQNNLQWLWAREVAAQLGDRDQCEQQAIWKLTLGVPILREDSPSFRASYDTFIRPHPYEQKLEAMRALDFGVTRLMKVKQMVRYLDAVERECLSMGLTLTRPDPDLAAYQARHREKEAA